MDVDNIFFNITNKGHIWIHNHIDPKFNGPHDAGIYELKCAACGALGTKIADNLIVSYRIYNESSSLTCNERVMRDILM